MDSNKGNSLKIIVAHPGRQHSYRVAKALKESGLLYKYATTVYNKDGSLLMHIIKLFLGNENSIRAKRRKCASLEDEDVIQFCELQGLILLALIRLDKSKRISKAYNSIISRKFQRKLAKYIIDEKVDAVISYDTNSAVLFRILQEKAPQVIRIMDNAAPNRHFMYEDFHRHWDACGEFVKMFEVNRYLIDKGRSQKYGEEVRLSNYHIVASSYSKKSLEYEGIPSSTIYTIPYGVSDDFFLGKPVPIENKLNCLFIGQINQLKGILQILDAAKTINNPNVTFNIVGDGYEKFKELLHPYEEYVTFHGYLYMERLQNQLKENQVFVFPTMGEGFGLVLLEAMAAGLVPITTRNCGGADIVNDNVNGFLIEVGDTLSLIERIQWCKDHPLELRKMSQCAIDTAHHYSWGAYEHKIVMAVREMIEKS